LGEKHKYTFPRATMMTREWYVLNRLDVRNQGEEGERIADIC
jgi:hypothetical protein